MNRVAAPAAARPAWHARLATECLGRNRSRVGYAVDPALVVASGDEASDSGAGLEGASPLLVAAGRAFVP